MKNKEYYNLRDFDFIYRGNKGITVGSKGSIVTVLPDTTVCDYFYELVEWLEQEYIEPIKLTDDEVVILRNIPEEYKWLIRIRHCGLIVRNTKPERKEETWEIVPSMDLYLFNHLFQFVTPEDEEPYNINELLKKRSRKMNQEEKIKELENKIEKLENKIKLLETTKKSHLDTIIKLEERLYCILTIAKL